MRLHRTARLACGVARAYAVVAEVERYPEFVPGYRRVRIVARSGSELTVEQHLALGLLGLTLVTHARVEPPERLEIRSDDPRFRRFRMEWRVSPEGQGCRVELRAELQPAGPLTLLAASPWLMGTIERSFTAFVARMEAGRQATPASPAGARR